MDTCSKMCPTQSKSSVGKTVSISPSRDIELAFLAQQQQRLSVECLGSELNTLTAPIVIAGVDEVGRGAIAGPASVGITLMTLETEANFPDKLRDSKLLTPSVRESLVLPCRKWVAASAVGHASADLVNQHGIMEALRMAATFAWQELATQGWQLHGVLLDGKHDWWSAGDLFSVDSSLPQVPVKTVVKGDAKCALIAAASVLAKVERDQLMDQAHLEYPDYQWSKNKGYATKAHITALSEKGLTPYHRSAWNLPGLG